MYGQLGQGLNVLSSSQPLQIAKLKGVDIQSVSCGQNHSLFLSSNGIVYACGNGFYGQLGLDVGIDYFVPMPIQKLADYRIVQIACGETFSLFVSDQNELFVSGMLEVDEDVYMQNRATFSVPHRIPFPEEIKRIAAGTRFALLLTVSGQVYQWGPDPQHPDSPSRPVCIESLSDKLITDITCGMLHCVAYSSVTGQAYAWGSNDSGELGINSQDHAPEPQEVFVPCNEKFVQIRGGGAFTLGISIQLAPVEESKVPADLQTLFTASGNVVTPILRHKDTLDSDTVDSLFNDTVIRRDNQFSYNI